jgi:hypothetical protein
METRCGLNHRTRPGQHHDCMETVRTIADKAWRESWNRAVWPSLVLTLAVSLDQCTRGPSITAMILTQFFS